MTNLPDQPGDTHLDADDGVAHLARGYAAAAAARDIDAFMALYDDAVVVHELFSEATVVGADAWRAQVATWFGDLGEDEENLVEPQELTVHADGRVALAHGLVRYGALNTDGSLKYGMVNRLTWGLRRGDDGVWRIVHEHTSVPLDPATMTPVLG